MQPSPLIIREHHDGDLPAIRACVIELQDYERRIDARLPAGAQMVDAYVARMLQRCVSWQGTVLVAERHGEVVGFVCVWTRVVSDEPDEGQEQHGLVSDLVVLPAVRGTGLGRALLAEAQAYARRAQVRWLRIGVLSANTAARELYLGAGFRPYQETLERDLAADD